MRLRRDRRQFRPSFDRLPGRIAPTVFTAPPPIDPVMPAFDAPDDAPPATKCDPSTVVVLCSPCDSKC